MKFEITAHQRPRLIPPGCRGFMSMPHPPNDQRCLKRKSLSRKTKFPYIDIRNVVEFFSLPTAPTRFHHHTTKGLSPRSCEAPRGVARTSPISVKLQIPPFAIVGSDYLQFTETVGSSAQRWATASRQPSWRGPGALNTAIYTEFLLPLAPRITPPLRCLEIP
jgi:hypothetical protein